MTLRAVFGVPLYNGAPHLAEALESLLAQTCGDLAVVLVDDGSTDATEEIARRYVALDRRVTYDRNEMRLGMTRNWCRTFERARELYGDFAYFAWGSDHDVWHPRWLAVLTAELDSVSSAVAAYPLNVGISEGGIVIREPWRFEVRGEPRRRRRVDRAIFGMSAGNMVYGLFRQTALERTGVYHSVVLPDRLLLAELALYGDLVQIPEILWHRRFRLGVTPSLARQRRSFYPGGVPRWSYAPWPLLHSLFLFQTLVIRGCGRPELGRAVGLAHVLRYLVVSSVYNTRVRWRKSKKRQRAMKWLRTRRASTIARLKRAARRVGLAQLLRPLRRRGGVAPLK